MKLNAGGIDAVEIDEGDSARFFVADAGAIFLDICKSVVRSGAMGKPTKKQVWDQTCVSSSAAVPVAPYCDSLRFFGPILFFPAKILLCRTRSRGNLEPAL